MSKKLSVGEKFGRWTVISEEFRLNGKLYCKCRCDCGIERDVYKTNLIAGKTLSCGCLTREKTSIKNTIELMGKKFGRLFVLGRSDVILGKSDEAIWKCLCDCGNTINVRGYSLRTGNTKSCGCLYEERKKVRDTSKEIKQPRIPIEDLTGKTFGRLKVISVVKRNNGYCTYYCKCQCGNYVDVFETDLISGRKKSCGCLLNEYFTHRDISGIKFGKLTPVEYIGESKWICKCDCGGTKTVLASNLKRGLTKSCGCINSSGEEAIKQWLIDNRINYIQQYVFDDCVYKRKLRFDFAILDDLHNIKLLVEFDGEQHYTPSRYQKDTKKNIDVLNTVKARDNVKNQYCIEHNIKLLRIPYWEFENIEEILSKELGLVA